MTYKKQKERPMTSCVYYGKTPAGTRVGPYCTLTTYSKCNPDTCPWYLSEEMRDASYENARRIWAKNHGTDNYYELGYGPKMRQNPRKNLDIEEEQKA